MQEGATKMKTQSTKIEGINLNHNLGGLKVKAQVVEGIRMNHNLGGLKVNR